MEILLANPRGFCAGVNMAIECLDEALRFFGSPIYVYHEIVHNRHVVETFTQRGVIFVDSLEEVPDGARLLFSAHGVSPALKLNAQQKNLKTIDATCPLVTKVHKEALKFAAEGHHILLIGHNGHDEVIGTFGEAPHQMTIIEDEQNAQTFVPPPGMPLAYLTQTTLSVDDAGKIIGVLKRRFPDIQSPPKQDICYATQNRQDVVRELAPLCDIVLVVGSQNSSNSQRLKELGEQLGRPSYLIDGPDDLDLSAFSSQSRVMVTAGASAPEHLVQKCILKLKEHFEVKVTLHDLRKENTVFGRPASLKKAMSEQTQFQV